MHDVDDICFNVFHICLSKHLEKMKGECEYEKIICLKWNTGEWQRFVSAE